MVGLRVAATRGAGAGVPVGRGGRVERGEEGLRRAQAPLEQLAVGGGRRLDLAEVGRAGRSGGRGRSRPTARGRRSTMSVSVASGPRSSSRRMMARGSASRARSSLRMWSSTVDDLDGGGVEPPDLPGGQQQALDLELEQQRLDEPALTPQQPAELLVALHRRLRRLVHRTNGMPRYRRSDCPVKGIPQRERRFRRPAGRARRRPARSGTGTGLFGRKLRRIQASAT